MKKNKHITINFNDNEFQKIQNEATKENRTLTNYLYLLITEALKDEKSKKTINKNI